MYIPEQNCSQLCTLNLHLSNDFKYLARWHGSGIVWGDGHDPDRTAPRTGSHRASRLRLRYWCTKVRGKA